MFKCSHFWTYHIGKDGKGGWSKGRGVWPGTRSRQTRRCLQAVWRAIQSCLLSFSHDISQTLSRNAHTCVQKHSFHHLMLINKRQWKPEGHYKPGEFGMLWRLIKGKQQGAQRHLELLPGLLQIKLCWTPICVCIAWHISGMFHLNMKTDHSTASREQESSLRRETCSHYEIFSSNDAHIVFSIKKKVNLFKELFGQVLQFTHVICNCSQPILGPGIFIPILQESKVRLREQRCLSKVNTVVGRARV